MKRNISTATQKFIQACDNMTIKQLHEARK